MADIKISELTTASEIKNEDNIELSQNTGNGLVSLKATILALATKIVTAINFTSALNTSNKTITGAINEAAASGGTDVIAEDFDSTATYAVGDYCIYEGSLYKCTTAVTTAGDWDSSDWTETLVMDEVESGGGGGGGGHTIKDDGGNALTQRANLQFKGVYAHDDSTNSASVVEVAREMTYAEFQQLSASEKKGLITIIDRQDADALFVNGVFIDTDNVIVSETTIAAGGLSYTATEDCFVSLYLWGSNSTSINIDGNYIAGNFSADKQTFNLFLKKGQILTTTSGNANNTYKVYGIQAGTNPSIPDYSTTEHKTGRKWIDGSDIWECTITGLSIQVTTNWSNTFGDSLNIKDIIDCKLYDASASTNPILVNVQNVQVLNGGIRIQNDVAPLSTRTITRATLQYTKTS